MPAQKQISKQEILQAAFDLVRQRGLDALNARSLAKKLQCSTQPIYLSYQGMDELKSSLTQKMDAEYDSFVEKRIHADHYLLSKAKAHILFSIREKKLYQAMFLSNALKGICMEEIAGAAWNQKAVLSVMEDCETDRHTAQKIFIAVWLFSTGLATELSTNQMDLEEEAIDRMLTELYERMKIGYASKQNPYTGRNKTISGRIEELASGCPERSSGKNG